jgi:cyclohexa-1,5-dienecarbonyl-CoA hydratase
MKAPFKHIRFNVEDRVARINLSRPPLNVLNIAMLKEISSALTECTSQELVAIVFAGDPNCRAFSAGVAVEEHVPELVYQMLDSFHQVFRTLEQLAKPTVAVVDGPALGGGCELVAACDIVIATDRAHFGQPEIKLGVFPPVASVLLPRIIGDKPARELILTGETIDATEAARLRLCNYVVPVAQLEQKLTEVLAKLRELSTASLEFARRSLDIGRGLNLDTTLKQLEDMYLNELMKSRDAGEGVKSFMEKRKPLWRNR